MLRFIFGVLFFSFFLQSAVAKNLPSATSSVSTPLSADELASDLKASALRAQMELKNKEIQTLEADILRYKKELEEVSKETNTLGNAIKVIDITRRNLSTNITLTQKKIDNATLQIEALQRNISSKTEGIQAQKNGISETLKEIQSLDRQTLFETFLSGESFGDVWAEVSQMQDLENDMHTKADELKNLREDLSVAERLEEKKRNELSGYQANLLDQKRITDAQKKEKDVLLKETKNKESNYKKLLLEREARRKAFENELLDIESELRLITDPSKIPLARHGLLGAPLAELAVTQKFGHTEFSNSRPSLYGAGGGHNGTDFKASVGTPVQSAASGEVIGVGDTDTVCYKASYGKWVLVSHGENGLSTLYAHLSLISVREGQRISKNELVGYSGNTGYSTGPHLHFTVFVSEGVQIATRKSTVCAGGTYRMPIADLRAYLDPMLFL